MRGKEMVLIWVTKRMDLLVESNKKLFTFIPRNLIAFTKDFKSFYSKDRKTDTLNYWFNHFELDSMMLEIRKDQFIDTVNNRMCYIGALGMDVANAPYSCRILTFELIKKETINYIITDNDMISIKIESDIILMCI